jgi:hypothetical protein
LRLCAFAGETSESELKLNSGERAGRESFSGGVTAGRVGLERKAEGLVSRFQEFKADALANSGGDFFQVFSV